MRLFTSLAGMERGANIPTSRHSFCAHFVEVRVEEDYGTIRVARVVSALDAGRLYNPRLADSQFKGGIVMGIGMALLEEGITDPRNGRTLSVNLAGYRIATNADIRGSRRSPLANPTKTRRLWAARRNWRSSAWRPPSPTRSSTPPANASAASRSRWRICWFEPGVAEEQPAPTARNWQKVERLN